MSIELTEDNFLLYAIKHYNNPTCKGLSEFESDLKRFRYLKRLFKKLSFSKNIKDHLILNHLVVLYNLFGVEAATLMLFFKIDRRHWPQLKTFIVFLNCMPVGFSFQYKGEIINGYEIPLDEKVQLHLGNI